MRDPIGKGLILIIIGVFCTLVWSLSAYADMNSSDKWEFQLAPYAWLAGQKGEVATLPGLPKTDIDYDFYDDIAGNIKGAFMLALLPFQAFQQQANRHRPKPDRD